MKHVSLKTNLGTLTLALTTLLTLNACTMHAAHRENDNHTKHREQIRALWFHEKYFIATKIGQLGDWAQDIHQCVLEFLDKSNMETYETHLDRLTYLTDRLAVEIISPLQETLAANPTNEMLRMACAGLETFHQKLNELYVILKNNRNATPPVLGGALTKFKDSIKNSHGTMFLELKEIFEILKEEGCASAEIQRWKEMWEDFKNSPINMADSNKNKYTVGVLLGHLRHRLNCK